MVHFSYVKKFRALRNMHTPTPDSVTTRRTGIAHCVLLLVLCSGLCGPPSSAQATDPPASPETPAGVETPGGSEAKPVGGDPSNAKRPTTVQLVVDFGDGFQKRYTRLSWRPGMTVWDVLDAATRHPRPLRIQHQGQKDTLLVLQIDDVSGGGPDDRHWIYRVNKNLAERSAGVVEVQAGDTVLWRLESYP